MILRVWVLGGEGGGTGCVGMGAGCIGGQKLGGMMCFHEEIC